MRGFCVGNWDMNLMMLHHIAHIFGDVPSPELAVCALGFCFGAVQTFMIDEIKFGFCFGI